MGLIVRRTNGVGAVAEVIPVLACERSSRNDGSLGELEPQIHCAGLLTGKPEVEARGQGVNVDAHLRISKTTW